MNISKLIGFVREANELFEVYGHAINLSDVGLLPQVALGLTALSGETQVRIATRLARRDSNHEWLSVNLEDRRAYMAVCTEREDEIMKWLRHYFNPGFGLRNDKNVFVRVIEDLERLR